MAQTTPYGYYYGDEAEQYTFYRLPKVLFTGSRYKGLSDGAKILYGLMLDRMGLSLKNGWLDDENRVYIYFTLEDVQEYMSCKHEKAVKLLAELDTGKGIGLIERVKRGQGKPTIIYVRKFIEAAEIQTSENQKSRPPNLQNSRLPKNRSQDFRKSECNKTDSNNTDSNDIEIQSVSHAPPTAFAGKPRTDRTERMNAYRELIMDNVEYEILVERYGEERLNSIVDLMVETVCTSRPCVNVNSEEYPAEIVRSRLLKLDSSDIEFVFDRLDEKTTKVRNIRAYTLTALYNAPTDKEECIRAEVNHDLYGGGKC